MEYEFDKEMDAILRRARVGEDVISPDAHLGADEIAAFAENALTAGARAQTVAHFADCARCRRILSNVMTLNSEAANVSASSVVTVAATDEKTPWHRRFFAFPQLAYAMGGLVLLFSGFFGYLILQNSSGGSDVSRMTEQPAQTEGIAPSAANSSVFSTANTNTATITTSTNTAANMSSTNSSSVSSANANVALAAPSAAKPVAPVGNAPAEAQTAATPAPQPETRKEDEKMLAKSVPAPVIPPNAAGATRDAQERDKNENKVSADEQSTQDSDDTKLRATRKEQPASPKKKSNEAGASRTVGGKNFNNVGGIWFDSAYTKQKTKDVRRGTNDYQKLDAGLRSIADQLGGTVVVVWNGKAYRIQ